MCIVLKLIPIISREISSARNNVQQLAIIQTFHLSVWTKLHLTGHFSYNNNTNNMYSNITVRLIISQV